MGKIEKGTCMTCKFRHSCCPHDYPHGSRCKYWKRGKCYVCKFVDAPDEDFFKRGCEAEYPSGCRKFERDWKKTFELLRGNKYET